VNAVIAFEFGVLLGVEGVGEVGAIGVPPAVINAILDALAPLGVTDISMRLLPVGDTREELRASRDRTRESVAYMAKDLR